MVGRVVAHLRVLWPALVAVVLVGVVVTWGLSHRTTSQFDQALELVPAETMRLSFTDWKAIRDLHDIRPTPAAAPTSAALSELLDAAFETDQSAASMIAANAAALQQFLGFSPVTAQWEALAQAPDGAVLVLKLDSAAAIGQVQRSLRSSGYTPPAEDQVVWHGGADLVGQFEPAVSPMMQHVVVLADQRLVLASDSASYVTAAAQVARGQTASLSEVRNVRSLARYLRPVAAMMWSRDFACEDLGIVSGDPQTQETWRELVKKAGKLTPVDGVMLALQPDGELQLRLAFESRRQAQANLPARRTLLAGPAPGRSSPISEDFTIRKIDSQGAVITAQLRPDPGQSFSLSLLNSGPLIFATC